MDRIIVYPGAIPLDTDMLNTNRNTMTALHALISATLGTVTALDGLGVTATTPPSMNIIVGQGSITLYGPLDGVAYGSLGTDITDSIVKMGVAVAPTTLTLTAPTTAGYAIVYLVEAGFAETDVKPVVLPYYNAANPVQPYLGPGNSGASQATVRQQTVTVQLKAGAEAPVGSTVVPPVDSGFVALATIMVLAGTTQVASGSVSLAATTRFTPWKLPDLMPGYAFAEAFTVSGSFTVPNGVTRLRLRIVGGGGAGASGGTGGGGGGGGAGGSGEHWLTGMVPGTVIPVTVGASGAPVSGSAGGPGGTSSFGSYCSASGGGGGSGTTGSLGGTASGTAISYPGAWGTDAVPGVSRGGDGGAPGTGKGGSNGAPGQNATNYGGGGGGGSGTGFGGGAGGGGIVIVEW
jgi:hypothetical protein